MYLKRIAYLIITSLLIVSCEDDPDNSLTNAEIDLGIKTTLRVGMDTVISNISTNRGFMYDTHMQILLPHEGRVISELVDWYTQNANKYARFRDLNIDLNYYYQKTILSLNVAAGYTALNMDTLFKLQINKLLYPNGLLIVSNKIMDGDSTPITTCFKNATIDTLYKNCFNAIKHELSIDVVGSNTNSNMYWADLLNKYNLIADNSRQILLENAAVGGVLTDDKKEALRKFVSIPDTTILANYITSAALDKIYYKIGEVEKQIRLNPKSWNGKSNGLIIQRVFGQ